MMERNNLVKFVNGEIKKIITENVNGIVNYYKKICELEKLKSLPIKFGRVGKGGACLTFNPKTREPLYISIDIGRTTDIGFALYHEIAHQICLIKYKDYGHGAKFRKIFNYLNDKYMFSDYEFKYLNKYTTQID